MTTKVRTEERLRDVYLAQTPLGCRSSPDKVAVPVISLLTPGASFTPDGFCGSTAATRSPFELAAREN